MKREKLQQKMRASAALHSVALFLLMTYVCAEEDLYSILGLGDRTPDEVTEKDVKAQFRILSKKYHPDQGGGAAAREMYEKVSRAHDVLSNKQKRKMYDISGEDGLKLLERSVTEGNRGGDPFGGLFGGLFGGGGGGQQFKGQTAQMEVEVPLSQAYNGAVQSLTITKQKLCRKCKGTGAASPKDFAVCKHCKGQGSVVQKVQIAPGFVQQMQQQCPHCNGKGKEIKKKCPTCNGNRVTRGESRIQLNVEKGIKDGHKVTFEMEADQAPDMIPGDVVIVVRTKDNDTFKRKGDVDLAMTVKLSLREALLGFHKTVVHMDGRSIELSRKGITPFGTVERIAGEGMPHFGNPTKSGDLYATYEFVLPTDLSEHQKENLDEILL